MRDSRRRVGRLAYIEISGSLFLDALRPTLDPMPVIIPSGFAEVVMDFTGPLAPDGGAASVFGTQIGVGESLGDVAVRYADAWVDNVRASTHSGITLVSVEAHTPTLVGTALVGLAGTNSADPAPPNVSILFHKVTTARGRRGRGRWFPPGMAFDFAINVGGMLDAGAVTALQGVAAAFLLDAQDMRILQGSEGASAPLDPPPPVIALLADPMVSTQRKRLR